jgi:hypothetical protein
MRLVILMLLAGLATACPIFAIAGDATEFNVRYAVNMEFLPPLIGERLCVRVKPCEIVRLDHFGLTLTMQAQPVDARSGRLTIDCEGRECALKDGLRSIDFRKNKRFVRFKVDCREYMLRGRTVIRYPGEEIGEILLAY